MGTIDGILHYSKSLLDEEWGLVGGFVDPDDWAFVDWVPEWNIGLPLHGMAVPLTYHSGPATIFSLVYAWALQQAADPSGFVQSLDTASEYRQCAQQVIHRRTARVSNMLFSFILLLCCCNVLISSSVLATLWNLRDLGWCHQSKEV